MGIQKWAFSSKNTSVTNLISSLTKRFHSNSKTFFKRSGKGRGLACEYHSTEFTNSKFSHSCRNVFTAFPRAARIFPVPAVQSASFLARHFALFSRQRFTINIRHEFNSPYVDKGIGDILLHGSPSLWLCKIRTTK